MFYTSSRATIKWWDPHTNKIKYCSYEKLYEHNNKFGKGCAVYRVALILLEVAP